MKSKSFFILLTLFIFITSCSSYKRLAYAFVESSKGASVALYVPNELTKNNIIEECDEESLDSIAPENIQDTIDACTKILNKIDDNIFLNVMIASFEETLEDYNLSLDYWENENSKPDSMHWVIDLSHIEIQELIEYQASYCGQNTDYEFVPTTVVNVASWFELINDEVSHLLFSEQNYNEYIIDCYYTIDSTNNVIINAELQQLSIEGFYNFAVILGKLYAGYCYDFFMNDYVRKEMIKNEKDYHEDHIYMRYDPYESYIYGTYSDKLIKIED